MKTQSYYPQAISLSYPLLVQTPNRLGISLIRLLNLPVALLGETSRTTLSLTTPRRLLDRPIISKNNLLKLDVDLLYVQLRPIFSLYLTHLLTSIRLLIGLIGASRGRPSRKNLTPTKSRKPRTQLNYYVVGKHFQVGRLQLLNLT